MMFQVISKKKDLQSCDPRFLRDFQSNLKKKRKVFTPAIEGFLRIFKWSSQTKKKPSHFHLPAGTPGHSLKTGNVSAKPGLMVSLPKINFFNGFKVIVFFDISKYFKDKYSDIVWGYHHLGTPPPPNKPPKINFLNNLS